MDIQQLLSKIHETLSDAKIGAAIGASQATVTRLRNGTHKQTLSGRAEAIKALAIRHGIDVS